MPKRETALKHATIIAAYLLVFWGFYRYFFKLPEEIEELIIKPIFWLIPVIYFVKKEKLGLSSLGITFKNIFPAIYLSLGLGVFFAAEALLINYLKYGSFQFAANIGERAIAASLGLSLATALSEEITFRGYLFNRVLSSTKSEIFAMLSTSFVWALIHVPITIFVWKLDFSASITYLILTALFGFGSAFLFSRTKNIVSSVLLHVLWEWPIVLFR